MHAGRPNELLKVRVNRREWRIHVWRQNQEQRGFDTLQGITTMNARSRVPPTRKMCRGSNLHFCDRLARVFPPIPRSEIIVQFSTFHLKLPVGLAIRDELLTLSWHSHDVRGTHIWKSQSWKVDRRINPPNLKSGCVPTALHAPQFG
jgi:hypothetical protein